VIDRFWLFRKFIFPVIVVVVALVLTLSVYYCSFVPNRLMGTMLTSVVSFVVACVAVKIVNKNIRP